MTLPTPSGSTIAIDSDKVDNRLLLGTETSCENILNNIRNTLTVKKFDSYKVRVMLL
jgi:hypothetical protein